MPLCDYATYALSLPGIWSHLLLEEGSPFSVAADASPNGQTAHYDSFGSFFSSSYPGGVHEQGTLLNQHRKTYGTWLQRATASQVQWYTHPSYGSDFTLIAGGFKPLDMTVGRLLWKTDQHNLTVAIETNGAVTFNVGGNRTIGTNEYQTAAGFVSKFACHMLAVAFVQSTKTVTIYSGDWNGNFQSSTGVLTNTPGTNGGAGSLCMGGVDGLAAGTLSAYQGSEAFVDDATILIGHALTLAEAQNLHVQSGYTGAISYPQSKGHRNNPWNRGATTGNPTLYASSAAAATQLNADRQLNTNSINYYQFDDPFYIVSGAYRKNPANCRPFLNMRYDGSVDAPLNANFSDVPVPYLGTGNAAAFGPAGGSDGHCTIYCPDTDEVWDMGVMQNYGGTWPVRIAATNGSPNITLDLTCPPAPFLSGAVITAAGFAAGTTVTTPWDGTKVVLSNSYTGTTGTITATVTPASGSGYNMVYGNKLSQVSLDPGYFEPPRSNMGARATGIPGFYGTPLISELLSPNPITHAIPLVVPRARSFPAAVYPAQRTDGSSGGSYALIEGMWLRLRQDGPTTALIAAMPYPAGRKLALACQQYGAIIVDSTGYNMNIPVEDHLQFAVVNGYDAYGADSISGVGTGGIFQGGNPYDSGNLSGFPWANFEVIDPTLANPASGTQPTLSAPTGLSGVRTNNYVTLTWVDQTLAQYYNVYSVTPGPTYTKIANSMFPQYSFWYPQVGGTVFAVTAVNGGGESAKSASILPPFPVRSRRRVRTVVG
jgi:hypothetical protein